MLTLIATLVLAGGLLSGCRQDMPAEYRQFFDLTPGERHERFRTFPLEKQLDVYFYATQRHPPDYGYAYDIARRGAEVIPTLVEKLEAEKDEHKLRDIIFIFEALASKGHMQNRGDVVAVIRQRASSMPEGTAKEESLRALQSIEQAGVS